MVSEEANLAPPAEIANPAPRDPPSGGIPSTADARSSAQAGTHSGTQPNSHELAFSALQRAIKCVEETAARVAACEARHKEASFVAIELAGTPGAREAIAARNKVHGELEELRLALRDAHALESTTRAAIPDEDLPDPTVYYDPEHGYIADSRNQAESGLPPLCPAWRAITC